MSIANKLKNLMKRNKRFKETSIQNVEDIKKSYFGKEAQIDTSKDLQNVEQDEVKELTYSHTDGWSLVCYSRNGKSLEELNCSCCSVASCDWRYPVSKLVVEWAETINNRGYISVLQLYEGEQVVVSLRCFLVEDYLLPEDGEYEVFSWLKTTSSQMNYGEHEAGVITLTWMRWWIQSMYCEECDSSHN